MHPYRGGILVLGDLVTWDSGKLHFGGSHVHAAPFHAKARCCSTFETRHPEWLHIECSLGRRGLYGRAGFERFAAYSSALTRCLNLLNCARVTQPFSRNSKAVILAREVGGAWASTSSSDIGLTSSSIVSDPISQSGVRKAAAVCSRLDSIAARKPRYWPEACCFLLEPTMVDLASPFCTRSP